MSTEKGGAGAKEEVKKESKHLESGDVPGKPASTPKRHEAKTEDGQEEEENYVPETSVAAETEEASHESVREETTESHRDDKVRSSLDTLEQKSDEDDISEFEVTVEDEHRESMTTQAGSYNSYSSSSNATSAGISDEGETLPRGFQDYLKKYSALFSKIAGTDDELCDEEAGKTFLKIDLNEIVSGYSTEEKISRDIRSTLAGMVRTRQDLICIENESIILQKGYEQLNGVRILTGGHMGNEPLYLDYVGKGMITGLVLGTVNDPPSVASVTTAMRELSRGTCPGIIVIIQNNVEYRLIFGLAMERMRLDGFLDIDMVAVHDDCFERCKSPAGRRGLAGIILILKLAGAMACSRKPLREISRTVRMASKNLVTISCMTTPYKAIGTGLDKNSKDGINFNGDDCLMVKRMIDYCVHPMKYFSLRLEPDDSFIVLLNTYRTKTPEFYIIVDLLIKELKKRNIRIERFYGDNFLTGFWPGYSISLMFDCNGQLSKYMDAPCNSSLWPRYPSKGDVITKNIEADRQRSFSDVGPIMAHKDIGLVKNAVVIACKTIIQCESIFNSMHFFGNYGTKMRKGADAIMQAVRMNSLNFNKPFILLIEISEILVENLPGVTGAMYGCLFEGAARSFVKSSLTTLTMQNWTEAMDEALKTLRAYSNAKGGIVSLALSLIPVVSAIHVPFNKLPKRSNRNPVLVALDSLRHDIEERMKEESDDKESLVKNQMDVESYALIIWLHAVFSSIYWKAPSDSKTDTSISTLLEEEVSQKSIGRISSSLGSFGREASSQKIIEENTLSQRSVEEKSLSQKSAEEQSSSQKSDKTKSSIIKDVEQDKISEINPPDEKDNVSTVSKETETKDDQTEKVE